MIKLTLLEDGSPIWIAPWYVVQVFPGGKDSNAGTTIHLVGQIQTHVRETPADVAGLVSIKGRRQ